MAMSVVSRASSMRVATQACRKVVKASPLLRSAAPVRPRQSVVVAADSDDDAVTRILSKAQDQFEASDKKAVVAGYAIGGLAAIFLLEWVMHLPLLNALIGFPVQLVGLIMLPVLVTRYALDGKDLEKDIESSLGDITKKLPGLSKE